MVALRSLSSVYSSAARREEMGQMSEQFDIFENLPSGSSFWRAFAGEREEVSAKMLELTRFSRNEVIAIAAESNEIVARETAVTLARLAQEAAGSPRTLPCRFWVLTCCSRSLLR